MKAERRRLLAEIKVIQDSLDQGHGNTEHTRQRLAELKRSLRALLEDMEHSTHSPWWSRWRGKQKDQDYARHAARYPSKEKRPTFPSPPRNNHPDTGGGGGGGGVRRGEGGPPLTHHATQFSERQQSHHDAAMDKLRIRQDREQRLLQEEFEEKVREMEMSHRDQQESQAEQIRREQESLLQYENALMKAENAKRELELAHDDLDGQEDRWLQESAIYRPSMAGERPKRFVSRRSRAGIQLRDLLDDDHLILDDGYSGIDLQDLLRLAAQERLSPRHRSRLGKGARVLPAASLRSDSSSDFVTSPRAHRPRR